MSKWLIRGIVLFLIFEAGLQFGIKKGRQLEQAENIEIITALLEENEKLQVDALTLKIMECESGFRHDVYGDSGASYGIVQIQYPTFLRLKKLSGIRSLKYSNPIHQVRLLRWSLVNGYGSEWACYGKI